MTQTLTHSISFVVVGEETIHCPSCEQRIAKALRRVPGVQDVRASAQTQQVSVSFVEEQVKPEQIQAKLAQLGYEVRRV